MLEQSANTWKQAAAPGGRRRQRRHRTREAVTAAKGGALYFALFLSLLRATSLSALLALSSQLETQKISTASSLDTLSNYSLTTVFSSFFLLMERSRSSKSSVLSKFCMLSPNSLTTTTTTDHRMKNKNRRQWQNARTSEPRRGPPRLRLLPTLARGEFECG